MLLFDGAQQAIRRFGPDGRYLDQIGRPGQGPGEFNMPWDLSTDAAGHILLAEYRGQISAYDAAGSFVRRWQVEGWISPAATQPQSAVVGNQDGSIAVLAMSGRNVEDHRIFLLDQAGRVQETVVPSVPWIDEIEFGHQRPALGLAWSPTGFGVAGVSSRLGFQIFRPGSSKVIRVEHQLAPPLFVPQEREAWARYAEFIGRRQGRPDAFPAPPAEKPRFRSIVAARTGEIWVVKHTRARPNPNAVDSIMGLPALPDWIEPFEAEVYSSEGEHLATVEGPEDFQLFFASGDTVWGVVRGEFLEPYVVRLSMD
ncbi:MAG: 6-bladed beta-propeller, partial [Thioalkalivibrio sp.]|nr:6-bladed beta-propeller [Thioalkalivibrio sp.]